MSGFNETKFNTDGRKVIATLYSNNSDDSASLQQLVDNYRKIYIAPATTLKIKNVNVTQPVDIYGGGTIEFIGNFATDSGLTFNVDGCSICDITFTNNTGVLPAWGRGSLRVRKKKCRVEHCTFYNGAIFADYADDSVIEHNVFLNGYMLLIYGKNITINNNYVDTNNVTTDPAGTGIKVVGYADGDCKEYHIFNNKVVNNKRIGIELFHYCSNSEVYSNTIYTTPISGVIGISISVCKNVNCTDNTVSMVGGTYADTSYAGVECVNSTYCKISQNRIDNFFQGIMCNGTDYVNPVSYQNIMNDNTIIDCVYGVRLQRATISNIVANNVINATNTNMNSNSFAIFAEEDGKVFNYYHNIFGNKIMLKSNTTAYSFVAIRSSSNSCILKNNIIELIAQSVKAIYLSGNKGVVVTENMFTIDPSITDVTAVYGVYSTAAVSSSLIKNNTGYRVDTTKLISLVEGTGNVKLDNFAYS